MSAADMDLSKIPSWLLNKISVASPPPGYKADLANPASRDGPSKVVIYVMVPLMAITLIIRLYVRGRIQKSWGGDDVLAVLSAICVGGYCGVVVYPDGPGGEHLWEIPIGRITSGVMKANLAAQCLYGLASIFTKSALLFLYLRIFRPAFRAGTLIWAGLSLVLVSHVAAAVAQIVILVPRRGQSWFRANSSTVQHDATKTVAAQGVLSVFTDFYVLFIPMHLAASLHLPLARKVGVCAIFLTGLIACVCSLVGTVIRFRLRHTEDMFWDAVPAYILTVVELSIGVICSCLPVLPVLFKRMAKSNSYRRSVSFLRYFKTASKQTSDEKATSNAERKDLEKINLAIPKPTLMGLKSIILGGGRGQTRPGGMNDSFAPLDSFEDDYHAQLKTGRR